MFSIEILSFHRFALVSRESGLRVVTPPKRGIFLTIPRTQLKEWQNNKSLYFWECSICLLQVLWQISNGKTMSSASERPYRVASFFSFSLSLQFPTEMKNVIMVIKKIFEFLNIIHCSLNRCLPCLNSRLHLLQFGIRNLIDFL
jgi:hypothetical protein